MKRVGVYRLNFPEPSETFIRAQLATYRRYSPEVFAKQRIADTDWPVNAVSDHGRMAERAFLATRSARWHAQSMKFRPDLLHAHFGVDGVYALPLAERLGVPLVTTFHGFDILTRARWWIAHPSIPLVIYRAFLNQLKSRGARFIAVSRFVEDALLAAGFPRDRVVQHYIGVDTERFSPSTYASKSGRYVLCVGRHVEFKGIDVLLRAFSRIASRYAGVRLVQVGAGPLTGVLHELAEQLGLSGRVEFLGVQPNDKVLELMRGAEVFALPSLTQESGQAEALGIVFNEASACAIPIASTLSGGIPEVVLDGETGLLCPERDEMALAANLDQLLGDAGLRRRLGARGRELVCERFNLKRQTERLEDIYDGLL